MNPNWAISFVRTVVAPLLVGCLGQLLLFAWSDDVSLILRVATTSVIAAAWYIVARLAQVSNPQLGFLLIVAAQPHYTEDGDLVTENELLISIVRTVVPLVVATVLGYLLAALFGGITPVLTLVAVAVAYYGILRWIEDRAKPDSTTRHVIGWMLGAKAVPHY